MSGSPPSESGKAAVAAVIIHYGTPDPTLQQVAAVRAWASEVVVIANDLSPDRWFGEDQSVRWLVPPRNLGYGGAANYALAQCDSLTLVILNNDVSIPPSVAQGAAELVRVGGAGVVGLRMTDATGTFVSGAGSLTRWLQRGRMREPAEHVQECQWVTGAAMFVSRECLQEVGFDERFFLGWEDADLCVRAKRAGFRVVVLDSAGVTHIGGTVIGSARWYYYSARNHIWYLRSSRGWGWSWVLVGLYLLRLARVEFADLVKGRGWSRSRLMAQGIWHGLALRPVRGDAPYSWEPIELPPQAGVPLACSGSPVTQVPIRVARALADSVVTNNLVLMGVTTLGLVVTARYLGVGDRGLYLTWSSWGSMVGTLALLGSQSFIVVAAAQLDTRVSVWRLRRMLAGGLVIAVLGAFASMSYLAAGHIAGLGGILMAAAGPIVAVNAAVQQANGHHNWRFNVARALSTIAGLITALAALVLFHPGVESLFLWLGLGCFLGAVASIAATREPADPGPRLIPLIRQLAPRGAPLVLLGWLLLNVDTIAVSIAGDSDDVGLYGVGVAAKSVVLAVGTVVGLKWFATRNAVGSLRNAGRPFAPGVAVALGIVLVAPVAVPLVLGRDFSPSVPAVQLLAVGGVLASVDFLLSHMLLIRVGYVLPTILRLSLVSALVAGIYAVGGRPTPSAGIFCCVMLASVMGQIWIGKRESERRDSGH